MSCNLICQRPECFKIVPYKWRKYCSAVCRAIVVGKKISFATTGKILSEETKQRIRLAMVGRRCSEETRQKHRLRPSSMLGKHHSEETKQKIRLALLGRRVSKESIVKQRNTVRERVALGIIKPPGYYNVSKPEIAFGKKIEEVFGIKLIHNFKLKNKLFDYKHPTKNVLFEIDGSYWHSLPSNMENDKLKDKIAAEEGYELHRFVINFEKDVNELIRKKFPFFLVTLLQQDLLPLPNELVSRMNNAIVKQKELCIRGEKAWNDLQLSNVVNIS